MVLSAFRRSLTIVVALFSLIILFPSTSPASSEPERLSYPIPWHAEGHLVLGAETTPLHITGAHFDVQTRRVILTLKNTSDLRITAWTIKVAKVPPTSKAATYFTEDRFRRDEAGGIPAGAVIRYELPVDLDDPLPEHGPTSSVVAISTVIFEDRQFSGDPQRAQRIFEHRSRGYPTLVALDQAVPWDSTALTSSDLALETLDDLLGYCEGSCRSLGVTALNNLPDIVREAQAQPERARDLLAEFRALVTSDLRKIRRHTPHQVLQSSLN